MGNWIVPFKGRNHSSAINLNFLYQHDNIFIMDNHRAALWCWLPILTSGTQINVFHIDRHYDALFSPVDYNHFPHEDISNFSIDEYLSCGYENDFFAITPLFRWDNYLGLAIKKYGAQINSFAFATHSRGAKPENIGFAAYEMWEFPSAIESLAGDWIFNLDLDYFYTRMKDGKMHKMVSDEYIKGFGTELKEKLDSGIIKRLTISMSPECCNGWSEAEISLASLASGLGLNFSL